MKIKLNWIRVENFKGLKNFKADFKGQSAVVVGKNRTGKTTLTDAFFFLLTDANSVEQAKFNLLELKNTGEVIDNQDAVVEAEFLIDDRKIRLRKEYKQKWVKKHGSVEPELKANTTDHFFDGVPVKKTEFTKKLGEIIDPDIIRSVSDINYFCGRLKPERRREILMGIAGMISDQEICRKMGATDLAEMLRDKTPDDLKKILGLEMKEIEKALKDLPGRIDELHKMIPDTGDYIEEEVISSIKEIDSEIEEKKREILAIRSGLSVSEKERQVDELKIDMSALVQSVQNEFYNREKELIAKMDSIDRSNIKLRSQIENNINIIYNCESMIRDYQKEKEQLVVKWTNINDTSFTPSDTCYACGQILPDDVIGSQRDDFNLKKSESLKPINKRGRWLSVEIENLKSRIITKKTEIEKLEKESNEYLDEKNGIKKQIEQIESEKQSEIDRRTKALNDRIIDISNRIKQEMLDIAPAIEALEHNIADLERERGKLDEVKLNFVQADKCERRIEERQKQKKEFGKAHEEIKLKLLKLDDFSIWKSRYIEKNVNDKFEMVVWKLFEQFQHGGFKEICEATYQGVPYSTDLNTGAKINLGLDVIKAFQRHYGISLPIWVDNAESVTDWMIDMEDQIIKMVATPNIEKLEVIWP